MEQTSTTNTGHKPGYWKMRITDAASQRIAKLENTEIIPGVDGTWQRQVFTTYPSQPITLCVTIKGKKGNEYYLYNGEASSEELNQELPAHAAVLYWALDSAKEKLYGGEKEEDALNHTWEIAWSLCSTIFHYQLLHIRYWEHMTLRYNTIVLKNFLYQYMIAMDQSTLSELVIQMIDHPFASDLLVSLPTSYLHHEPFTRESLNGGKVVDVL